MDRSRFHISFATLLLCAFLLVSNIVAGVYFGTRYPHDGPMRGYLLFERVVIYLLIALWLTADAKRFEIAWFNRMGPFVFLIRPVLVPFYLWQTRRFKGIVPVLAFSGIVIVATAIGGLVYTLFIF